MIDNEQIILGNIENEEHNAREVIIENNENENNIAPFANIDHFYTHVIQNKQQYNCYLNNKQEIIQLPDKNGKWTINENFNWNTFSMKVINNSNIDIFDSLNINWNE